MALFRHVASGSFPGEQWSFTLHTSGSVSLDAAQQAWIDALTALWTGKLDALAPIDVVLTEASTADLVQATGQQTSRLIEPMNLPGVAVTTSLPPQVSVCVSLRTNEATRAGRGRFFLPPFAVATVDHGRLLQASQTAAVAAVQAMFSSLSGDLLQPVIYGRSSHTTKDIVSFNVGDVFDTQRRRRNGLIESRVGGTV